jgi:hypothetical protein
MPRFGSYGFYGVFPGTGGAVTPPPVAPSAGVGPWAPAVWTPLIWPAVVWPGRVGGVVVPPVQLGRDQVALQSIADLLAGTGEFDSVTFGTAPESARYASTDVPVVNLRRLDYSQRPDDCPSLTVRTVRYEIAATIRVRDQDEAEALLDRLDSVVLDAISLKGYGFCRPAKSIVGAGRFDTGAYPPTKIIWNGSFSYVTNSAVGRDRRELAWSS